MSKKSKKNRKQPKQREQRGQPPASGPRTLRAARVSYPLVVRDTVPGGLFVASGGPEVGLDDTLPEILDRDTTLDSQGSAGQPERDTLPSEEHVEPTGRDTDPTPQPSVFAVDADQDFFDREDEVVALMHAETMPELIEREPARELPREIVARRARVRGVVAVIVGVLALFSVSVVARALAVALAPVAAHDEGRAAEMPRAARGTGEAG